MNGIQGSAGNGGLLGTVDMHGMCLIDSCANNNTEVSGSYGIGGLLGMGSLYSQICIEQSSNSGNVKSEYTGAGGIIGTADSLFIMSCSNTADVTGSTSYVSSDQNNGGFGTGGIAGGSGISYIYTCSNEGDITGHTGVGGIIGSTRVALADGSGEILLNNAMTKSCSNTGTVTGQTAVGGICGEAQFGGYAVYNTGSVVATAENSHVGGIVGNTSISVVHNALNSGKVSATNTHCAGGIIGKTTWGAIFASQNIGDMDVKADYAGGIIGLAGNYTMVNYCYNAGMLSNSGSGSTGGIIGEIGDPREWSASDIISCVIGSVECLMAISGPMIAVSGKLIERQIAAVGEGVSAAL